MTSPLEPFLPTYDAREHFAVSVRAPAAVTFALAQAFDLLSPWSVRAIFRLREVLLRSQPSARPTSQGLVHDLTELGWGQLATAPTVHVGGAYCQPWLADVRFHPLTAATFRAFCEPGYVKIAWTLEALPTTPAQCLLRTETRAVATDTDSQRRFRAYWRWARFGILPIRWFLLPAVRRAAEREALVTGRGT